jgi:hypothetical protein
MTGQGGQGPPAPHLNPELEHVMKTKENKVGMVFRGIPVEYVIVTTSFVSPERAALHPDRVIHHVSKISVDEIKARNASPPQDDLRVPMDILSSVLNTLIDDIEGIRERGEVVIKEQLVDGRIKYVIEQRRA